MPIKKFYHLILTSLALLISAGIMLSCQPTSVQHRTDIVVGLTLEPTGLDPTVAAGSSISEVVLYNVFETLTQINQQGQLEPLLATSWQHSADFKNYTFELLPNVVFHNAVPLTAEIVKYSLLRNRQGTPDAEIFANIAAVSINNPHNITVHLKTAEPLFPELLAQGTAIIVEPSSAASNANRPIGTGPFEFVSWLRGSSLELKKSSSYRQATQVKLEKVTFRFIQDATATVNSVLAHDIDFFPRGITPQSAAVFSNKPEFNLLVGNSSAKTIVALNHAQPPLDNLQVRRALSLAINRQEIIDNVAEGYAQAIGSHYPPNLAGFIDTTDINPYNPELAKDLLVKSGIKQPLVLSLKLPPVFYARQAGDIVAAQLSKIGVKTKIEYIDWARWLDEVYSKKNYALTIISHVERFDFKKPASAGYYFNYQSTKFNQLIANSNTEPTQQRRFDLLQQAQRQLAEDAVSLYLYNPQWLSVADARLKNVPQHFPLFTTQLAQVSW